MNVIFKGTFKWLFTTFMALSLSGCGYSTLQTTDEISWAQVLNQYQRRAYLVPNWVDVVGGYAAPEKDVLPR